jgi:dihydrofolate synthase / folylpolyglutamate synthase
MITNISRDHTNVLGHTTPEIAREKAGIVKAGVPVITGVGPGPAGDVIAAVCRSHGSALYRLGSEIRRQIHPSAAAGASVCDETVPDRSTDVGVSVIDVETPWGKWNELPLALRGEHQADNAALAVAATTLLGQLGWTVPHAAVARGLARVRWPARIEVIGSRPTVVVDAAHNWAATQALLRTLERDFSSASRKILIFAATRDKDVAGMLWLLLPRFDSVVLTQYQTNPRAVPIDELADLVGSIATQPCHVAASGPAAWRMATHLAGEDDLICVTGSFFIAAEVRELLLDLPPRGTEPGRGDGAIYSRRSR